MRQNKINFRIFPMIILAVASLMCLKAMGIMVRGGYLFPSETAPTPAPTKQAAAPRKSFGRMLTGPRSDLDDDQIATGSVHDAKKPEPEAKAPEKPAEPAVAQAPPPPPSDTERQLLEHLKERRQSLDDRAKELDMRETMLKATEKKVEDRIGDLKQVEAKDGPGGSAQKTEQENLKPLVIMYETMKPKDAAKVFDKLDLKVLVPIVVAMNPRKMSEVLAAMTPDHAEKLTVALASRNRLNEADTKSDTLPPGELPRLDLKK